MCFFGRTELIALCQLWIYWFSAPNSPFSACSVIYMARRLQAFLLYRKDTVRILSVEGAKETSQGEGGFSFRFPSVAFCFVLFLLHGPSVMDVCENILWCPDHAVVQWPLSLGLGSVAIILGPSQPHTHSSTLLSWWALPPASLAYILEGCFQFAW